MTFQTEEMANRGRYMIIQDQMIVISQKKSHMIFLR